VRPLDIVSSGCHNIIKIIRLKEITIAVSLKNIVKIYWNKIWKLHKVPQKVLSNRGPQFVSKFIEDLIKTLEIKRTFKIFLRYYINYQQDNWTG